MARDASIKIEGLNELRRSLHKLEPDVEKLLRADIRVIAQDVATEAQERARSFARTGRFMRSIKPYSSGLRAVVGSNLPQAGVLHWGGTIHPRGVPIVFPARPVISEAVAHQEEGIVNRMADAIDQAARNAGWHT